MTWNWILVWDWNTTRLLSIIKQKINWNVRQTPNKYLRVQQNIYNGSNGAYHIIQ